MLQEFKNKENKLKKNDFKFNNNDTLLLSYSLFEKIISGSIYFYVIGEYLDSDNIKLLLTLSKNIYNNNKQFTYKIINDRIIRASQIILRFMKKYTKFMLLNTNIVNFVNSIMTRKNVAVYYFRHYQKKYINGWYNIKIPWKQELINEYKTNYTENPTRIDLYILIKKMPINIVFDIGW